jgi:hypothetical protein
LTPPFWRNAIGRSDRETGLWRFATNLPERRIGDWRNATDRSERETGLRHFASDLQEYRKDARRFARDLAEAAAGDFPPFVASRGVGGRFSSAYRFPGRRRAIFRRSSLPGASAGDFSPIIASRDVGGRFPADPRFPGRRRSLSTCAAVRKSEGLHVLDDSVLIFGQEVDTVEVARVAGARSSARPSDPHPRFCLWAERDFVQQLLKT